MPTQSTSSAVNKLSKELKTLRKQVNKTRPELIWYCNGVNQALTGPILMQPTEAVRASGTVNGVEISLSKFQFRFNINCAGTPVTDHVNYRVIVARSKVGALTLADFPSTIHGCVDLDDKVVYYDKTFGSHANYYNAGSHLGFNQPIGTVKRSYKNSLRQILDSAIDVKNALYVAIIADNYGAGSTMQGDFVMHYYDA